MTEKNDNQPQWPHGIVSLSRDAVHAKMMEMMGKEPRDVALDVPPWTGILARRLRELGFEVSCCDLNPSYFLVSGLDFKVGDLNHEWFRLV